MMFHQPPRSSTGSSLKRCRFSVGGVTPPSLLLSLLPLWEKVAIGGLWPPYLNKNADALHRHTQSAPDEGSVPADTNPSSGFDASASKPPSPARGEGVRARMIYVSKNNH